MTKLGQYPARTRGDQAATRPALNWCLTKLGRVTYLGHMSKILTAEAAKILGVSVRTVHRQAESGELPFEMKLPGPRGAYVFDEDAIRALVTKGAAS